MYEQLNQKINDKTIQVGIIGLGYVGLPLMHSICKQNIKVTGFDVDDAKVELLNQGKTYLDTVSEQTIASHVNSGHFQATADMSKLHDVDVIIICVPTPLGVHKEPDLSYVTKTTETIAQHMRDNQIIVLESTTYPGTTTEVIKPILERGGKKSGRDFYLAYSPEREDPGNADFETATIPKIIGGDGDEATDISYKFYACFLDKVIKVSSAATAEAVKITENVFRAVNIALVNELKVIYDKMGIDIWEVVDAAKTKPFGYMPFYPGPGLGGHCIPIDPFYLTWKAKEYDINTRFIELAGEINVNMPEYVLNKTAEALNRKKQKSLAGSKIIVSGVAYKKNVNDQRESPAFPLIKMLIKHGATVEFYDPLIPELGTMRNFPEFSDAKSIAWSEAEFSGADAVIIVTDHDAIDYNQ